MLRDVVFVMLEEEADGGRGAGIEGGGIARIGDEDKESYTMLCRSELACR